MNEDDDAEIKPINRELSPTSDNLINNSQSTAIYQILRIDPQFLEFPVNSLDHDSLNNTSGRAFKRAQRIVGTMIKQICSLLSPSSLGFKFARMYKKMTLEAPMQKFSKNVSNLIFIRNENTQIIV